MRRWHFVFFVDILIPQNIIMVSFGYVSNVASNGIIYFLLHQIEKKYDWL